MNQRVRIGARNATWTAIRVANYFLLLGIFLLAYHLHSHEARGRGGAGDGVSAEFVRGDADDDGKLSVTDPIFLLRFLFLGDDMPPCAAAADANDDGKLELSDAIFVLSYLFLTGEGLPAPFPTPGFDPTPDLGCRQPPLPPVPPVGSLGGPDRELTEEETLTWLRGRQIFGRRATIAGGLGPVFNGDSCRGCHHDPVIGGAGGLDLDVVRFAFVNDDGVVEQMDGGPAVSRLAISGVPREELPAGANVVETRQTPTLLGLGLVDRIPDEVILANTDPDDADGDGISGRSVLVGGRIGRFGHKAGIPTLADFSADALVNETGVTLDPIHSSFAGVEDSDAAADPEFSDSDFLDLNFFVSHLAFPPRATPEDPQMVENGETVFHDIGCARCHIPELQGDDGPVVGYSDVLLHAVVNPAYYNVSEPGVEPQEFRTAPLRGLRYTAPYLHDGSAETIEDAILKGHFGEAVSSRVGYAALDVSEKLNLLEFLNTL